MDILTCKGRIVAEACAVEERIDPTGGCGGFSGLVLEVDVFLTEGL